MSSALRYVCHICNKTITIEHAWQRAVCMGTNFVCVLQSFINFLVVGWQFRKPISRPGYSQHTEFSLPSLFAFSG